jgi:hypothetical protein
VREGGEETVARESSQTETRTDRVNNLHEYKFILGRFLIPSDSTIISKILFFQGIRGIINCSNMSKKWEKPSKEILIFFFFILNQKKSF